MVVTMILLPYCASPPLDPILVAQRSRHFSCFSPCSTIQVPLRSFSQCMAFSCVCRARRGKKLQSEIEVIVEEKAEEEDDDDDVSDEEYGGYSGGGEFRGREKVKDYDRDPEFAEILGSCLDGPDKARSKMEERLRTKRNKILHTKNGSAIPMKVIFNKFDYSNSYIRVSSGIEAEYGQVSLPDYPVMAHHWTSWWMQFPEHAGLSVQLSESDQDKRPSYDAIQGANVNPATFYNIGDFKIQDNLGRIWIEIGTTEPLLLDVLINALTQISSDPCDFRFFSFVGIKQLVFGGSEFENWKEGLTSEDAGCSTHKI